MEINDKSEKQDIQKTNTEEKKPVRYIFKKQKPKKNHSVDTGNPYSKFKNH